MKYTFVFLKQILNSIFPFFKHLKKLVLHLNNYIHGCM